MKELLIERSTMIKKLREAEIDDDYILGIMWEAADMIADDAVIRNELARRTVERDMAISMVVDIDARVPMTDAEIRKIQSRHPTENNPMPFARAILAAQKAKQ